MDEILNQARRRLKGRPHPLITVDGFDGSGKTSLSKRLAEDLGAVIIHLDDFLSPNRNAYVSELDMEAIRNQLEHADVKNNPVIMEGVCVGLVLRLLGLQPDLTVYCKEIGPGRYWPREEIFGEFDTAEAALETEEWRSREFSRLCDDSIADGDDPLGGLYRELIQYHFDSRPHESADLVYAWTRSDGGRID